jgi:hypothetical protein
MYLEERFRSLLDFKFIKTNRRLSSNCADKPNFEDQSESISYLCNVIICNREFKKSRHFLIFIIRILVGSLSLCVGSLSLCFSLFPSQIQSKIKSAAIMESKTRIGEYLPL